MNRHLKVIGAILRKDWLLLWPLAVLITALTATQVLLLDLNSLSQAMRGLLTTLHLIVLNVSIGFFVVIAIQNDTPASTRHEWLTRPIARIDLLTAKLALILVALIAPLALCQAIITYSVFDVSATEALQRALNFENAIVLLALIVAAALTSTILQTAGAILTAIVAASLIFFGATRLSGFREDYFISGTQWIAAQFWLLSATAVGMALVWLQFGYRKTALARSLLAFAVIALAGLPIFFSWHAILSIQEALSRDPSVAQPVQLVREEGCFESTIVNPGQEANTTNRLETIPTDLQPSIWTVEQQHAAGPDAIGFATAAIPTGVPNGWRLRIGSVEATYTSDDTTRHTLGPLRLMPRWRMNADGELVARHFWLISRNTYEGLSRDPSTQLQLDFFLSLLKPSHSYDISIGAKREYFPGVGYCGAKFNAMTSRIDVECFKLGNLPALLTVELPDTPKRKIDLGFADYTPPWLDFFQSRSYTTSLRYSPSSAPSQVIVTAYEDQAHFDRQLVIPGVLGAPPSACPAPPVN